MSGRRRLWLPGKPLAVPPPLGAWAPWWRLLCPSCRMAGYPCCQKCAELCSFQTSPFQNWCQDGGAAHTITVTLEGFGDSNECDTCDELNDDFIATWDDSAGAGRCKWVYLFPETVCNSFKYMWVYPESTGFISSLRVWLSSGPGDINQEEPSASFMLFQKTIISGFDCCEGQYTDFTLFNGVYLNDELEWADMCPDDETTACTVQFNND